MLDESRQAVIGDRFSVASDWKDNSPDRPWDGRFTGSDILFAPTDRYGLGPSPCKRKHARTRLERVINGGKYRWHIRIYGVDKSGNMAKTWHGESEGIELNDPDNGPERDYVRKSGLTPSEDLYVITVRRVVVTGSQTPPADQSQAAGQVAVDGIPGDDSMVGENKESKFAQLLDDIRQTHTDFSQLIIATFTSFGENYASNLNSKLFLFGYDYRNSTYISLVKNPYNSGGMATLEYRNGAYRFFAGNDVMFVHALAPTTEGTGRAYFTHYPFADNAVFDEEGLIRLYIFSLI